MGKGRSDGEHDLTLLVRLALHDRTRRLGRRRPLDLLHVGRLPGAVAARRLDEAGAAHPGPAQAPDLRQGEVGHVQVEDGAHRRRHEQRDERDGQIGRRLPRVGPVADAQRDGERADPELAGGQRRADRPRVEHGAADVDAVVDAGEHEVGLGPDGPEGAGDDREGGRGVEPVGLHRLGALDVGALVRDGRGIGHRADGGTGAAVVGAGRHHDDLVGRVATRPVGPVRQGPRERCQSGGAHPVVVGDENPHGALTLPPVVPGPRAGPSPVRLRVTGRSRPAPRAPSPTPRPWSASIHSQCRPPRPGSPSPRPPDSSGASGTAARRSSSARWAPRYGPTTSARPRSSTASVPTSGPTRAGVRCSPPGPIAWLTAATSTTGCGPRPRWTSRSATTPSTASCAGCPGRSRRGTRTSSPSACNSIPRPATRSPSSWRSSTTWAAKGLTVTTRAQSLEQGPIPFGLGFHPYLAAGTGTVDGAILHVPARHTLETDERGLPTGARTPVEGTERDFTTARFVGPVVLDTAYTTLERDADGLARATLDAAGWRRRGRAVGGRRLSLPHGVHGRHAGRGAAAPARRRH